MSRRQVALADIDRAKTTKCKLRHGWGIHFPRRGWLYNVSGFGAVEVVLKSGKTFLLGSDEPQERCLAIRRAIAW